MRSALRAWLIVAVVLAIGIAVAVAARLSSPAPAPAATSEQPQLRSTLLSNKSVHARACLTDGVLALLDIGERNLDVLTSWGLRHCRDGLVHYLGSYLERPQAEIDAYVLALVRREVESLAKGAP